MSEDFTVDLTTITDYEDMLIPEGKYQAVVTKAKAGSTQKGRPKVDLTLKIEDTVPAGEELDLDEYEDPIEKSVFATIYFPVPDDKKTTINMFKGLIRDWMNFFEVTADDPNDLKALASNFENTIGGILIKYEKMDRDDPESGNRAVVKKAVKLLDE